MSHPWLFSHAPSSMSTSSSSPTNPTTQREHSVHPAHLQAHSVDKLRHQESLWREDLQRCGNSRTTTPTQTAELVNHPFVNLRQAQFFRTRHSCETLRFAYCTSRNRNKRMWSQYAQYTFFRCFFESRKSPANEASWNKPCFAIFNFWNSHMTQLLVVFVLIDVICQCQQSFVTWLCSILWLIVPEFCKSGKSMSELSEHILQRALRLFHNLREGFLRWSSYARRWTPAGERKHTFSLLIHSISQRTFLHDFSCHRSKQWSFPSHGFFRLIFCQPSLSSLTFWTTRL